MANKKSKAKLGEAYPGEEDAEGRPTKRVRVSRACDQCRLSREKCNGSTPCQSCASQSRECSYWKQPKKRGIQPNYIRALEVNLSWLLETLPEAKMELSRNLSQQDSRVAKAISGTDFEAAEALQNAFRHSSLSGQIDRLLAGERPASSEQLNEHILSGDSTDTDATGRQSLCPPEPTTSGLLQDCVRCKGKVAQGSGPALLTNEASGISDLPRKQVKLPKNAWRLLEHYFAFTHSWLPMTEKHAILKLMYEYPQEGLGEEQVEVAEYAELWSILALAATQLSKESTQWEKEFMRNMAAGLIPCIRSNAPYQVPHIKAMILLTLVDITEQRILAAWVRISSIISILLLFPLLLMLGVATEKCKHIHLSAFILEEALASRFGVPTHSRAPFVKDIGLVEENGLDEWSPWNDPLSVSDPAEKQRLPTRALSTMNNLVRIALRSLENSTSGSVNVNADSSVVFSLVENATLEQGRVQPCELLATHSSQNGDGGADHTA